MTEKEILDVKGKLRSADDGGLRNLFFKKNGLPKQILLTNRQILEKLGVLKYDPNTFESEAMVEMLRKSLTYIRKNAKNAGLAWIDIEIGQGDHRPVARHGFSNDIEQIMSNANKYDNIAENHKVKAKQTRKIAKIQEKLLAS